MVSCSDEDMEMRVAKKSQMKTKVHSQSTISEFETVLRRDHQSKEDDNSPHNLKSRDNSDLLIDISEQLEDKSDLTMNTRSKR